MVLQRGQIRRVAFAFCECQALVEPLGKTKLRLHFDDEAMLLIFVGADLVLVPGFFQ